MTRQYSYLYDLSFSYLSSAPTMTVVSFPFLIDADGMAMQLGYIVLIITLLACPIAATIALTGASPPTTTLAPRVFNKRKLFSLLSAKITNNHRNSNSNLEILFFFHYNNLLFSWSNIQFCSPTRTLELSTNWTATKSPGPPWYTTIGRSPSNFSA